MSDDAFASIRRRVSAQTRVSVEGEIADWLERIADACAHYAEVAGSPESAREFRDKERRDRLHAADIRSGAYRK